MKQTVSVVDFIDNFLVNLLSFKQELNAIEVGYGNEAWNCFKVLNDQSKTITDFFTVIKNNPQLFDSEYHYILIWIENIQTYLNDSNDDLVITFKNVLKQTEVLLKNKTISLGQKRIWDLIFYFLKYFCTFISKTNKRYKILDIKFDELYLHLIKMRTKFGNLQFLGKRSCNKTTVELALVYIFIQSFIQICQI
ncbi:hypothetical protein [Mycoplasmoides genitalium]